MLHCASLLIGFSFLFLYFFSFFCSDFDDTFLQARKTALVRAFLTFLATLVGGSPARRVDETWCMELTCVDAYKFANVFLLRDRGSDVYPSSLFFFFFFLDERRKNAVRARTCTVRINQLILRECVHTVNVSLKRTPIIWILCYADAILVDELG